MSENKTEIVITGNNAQFKKVIGDTVSSIQHTEGIVNSFSGNLKGMASSLTSMINPTTLLVGSIGAAFSGVVALTKKAIDNADELYDMAQRVGVSVESLSTLQHVAKISAVDVETLAKSLGFLSKMAYDQTINSDNSKNALTRLGVTARDANGNLKQVDQILYEVSDKFKALPNGTTKSAMAMELFSKTGRNMIPMLNEGSESLQKQADMFKALGLQISEDTAKKANDFNDNLEVMALAFQGIGISVMQSVIPSMLAVSDAVVAFTANSGAAVEIGGAFAIVFKVIGTAAAVTFGNLYRLGIVLGALGASMARFAIGDYSGMAKVWALGIEKVERSITDTQAALSAMWGTGNADYANQLGKAKALREAAQNEALQKQLENERKLANGRKETNNSKPGDLSRIDMNPFDVSAVGKGADIPSSLETTNAMTLDIYKNHSQQMIGVSSDMMGQLRQNAYAGFEDIQLNSSDKLNIMGEALSFTFTNMGNAMQNFYQQGGKNAKAYFTAYKVFATGQALISGYESVMHAYKEGTKWGGPILGTVYAVAAGVFAASQIAKINSASMGGGSVSAPSSSTSLPTSSNVSNNSNSQTITHTTNIIVYGSVVDHEKFARDISPALENAVRDGSSNLVINEV